MGSLLCSDLKEELERRILHKELDERLPTGALMSGEPVASAKDLQWYKGLLLEKQRELSSVQGDAGTQVPATGEPCRDPHRENAILTPPGNGAI